MMTSGKYCSLWVIVLQELFSFLMETRHNIRTDTLSSAYYKKSRGRRWCLTEGGGARNRMMTSGKYCSLWVIVLQELFSFLMDLILKYRLLILVEILESIRK